MSSSRHARHLTALEKAVLESRGELDPSVRRAIAERAAAASIGERAGEDTVPDALYPYIDKLGSEAYKIVARDFELLQEAGFSEDALFEATLAGAVGTGSLRATLGLDVLDRAREGGDAAQNS